MHYEKKIAVSKMEVHSIALVQRQSMQNFSLKISFCLYIKEENFLNLLCNITMTPTNMSVYRKVIQMLLCNITMTPTNMSGYRKVIQMSKIVGPIGPSDKILTRFDLNYFASDPMSGAIFQ